MFKMYFVHKIGKTGRFFIQGNGVSLFCSDMYSQLSRQDTARGSSARLLPVCPTKVKTRKSVH